MIRHTQIDTESALDEAVKVLKVRLQNSSTKAIRKVSSLNCALIVEKFVA